MPDRRETMAGYVANSLIELDDAVAIPDYRADGSPTDDLIYYNDGMDEEFESGRLVKLPAHFEVCPTCNGKGTHVNPSIDSHGITMSEMDELGDDFRESYFRGDYDQTCNECDGKRVVLYPLMNQLNDQEKEVWAAYEAALYENGNEIYLENLGVQF